MAASETSKPFAWTSLEKKTGSLLQPHVSLHVGHEAPRELRGLGGRDDPRWTLAGVTGDIMMDLLEVADDSSGESESSSDEEE